MTAENAVDDHARGSRIEKRERVVLMRCGGDGEAGIIRQLLETYGIPCQVLPDVTRSCLPVGPAGSGEVQILVPVERVAQARSLIADHRRQGLRVVPGGKD